MHYNDLLMPLRRLHGRLHEWRINVLPLYWERIKNPLAVYLVFTPAHSNLGDHAIAQSEIKLLNKLGIPFIEVPGSKLAKWRGQDCLNVMNGRVILIHGGGYLGTIWPESESLLRSIVINNPRSRILLLPNTFYYENSDWGKKDLKESISIYSSHKSMIIYAREKVSYKAMSKIYNDVKLAPDMVLRMNKCKQGITRNGCILCLRSDRERTRSEEEETIIHQQVEHIFGKYVQHRDMVQDHPISTANRDDELELQYDAFRHAELVVTDRLHGMIFCAITGTPCIVINSKSPKLRGCYEWIKELQYIQFCDDASQICSVFDSIPKQEWQYDDTRLLPFYEPLINDILLLAKGKRHAAD